MGATNWRLGKWQTGESRFAQAIAASARVLLLTAGIAPIGLVGAALRDVKPIAGDDLSHIEEARSFPLSVRVDATPRSPIHWSMLHGFGQPEPDGTWIVSIEGSLEIEVPEGARSLLLELYPFLPKGVGQRTIVIRVGEEVQLLNLGDGITVARVPVATNSNQRVTIECDFTVSPFLLGEGPDQRTLCVKLLSVEAIPGK